MNIEVFNYKKATGNLNEYEAELEKFEVVRKIDYDQLLEAFKRVVGFYGDEENYVSSPMCDDYIDVLTISDSERIGDNWIAGKLAREEARKMGIVL